jgi:hypothetical protein
MSEADTKLPITLTKAQWDRVIAALDHRNESTTDFPKFPCRNCGGTDRPQYKGTCNDAHCDEFDTVRDMIYKQLCYV